MADTLEANEVPALRAVFQTLLHEPHPRRTADQDAFSLDDDKKDESVITALRESLARLKVVARAKVTQDRVYSAAYHPEPTKDLIFFGGESTSLFFGPMCGSLTTMTDKHGQLGIWDARAPTEEVADEDGDTATPLDGESGRYWRLQVHWPATSRSSISSIKFDPLNSNSVCIHTLTM